MALLSCQDRVREHDYPKCLGVTTTPTCQMYSNSCSPCSVAVCVERAIRTPFGKDRTESVLAISEIRREAVSAREGSSDDLSKSITLTRSVPVPALSSKKVPPPAGSYSSTHEEGTQNCAIPPR